MFGSRNAEDARLINQVLSVFGVLYAQTCMRVEKELAARQCWCASGSNPPLDENLLGESSSFKSPIKRLQKMAHNSIAHLHAPHILPSLKRSVSSPRSPPVFSQDGTDGPVGLAERSSTSLALHNPQGFQSANTKDADANCHATLLSDPWKCGMEMVSVETTPETTASGFVDKRGGPAKESPNVRSVKGEFPHHQRALLYFGEALRSARAAVDSVLADASLRSVADLEKIHCAHN